MYCFFCIFEVLQRSNDQTNTTMKTTKLRKGEYQITLGERTLDLINDICIETGKNQGWNLYNEQGEWMGSSDTKKQMLQSLKHATPDEL